MNKFKFWQRWLLVVSYVIIVLGLLMAFSRFTLFFELFDMQFNPIFFGNKSITPEISRFQIWNFGVLGAVLISWGVFFVFIVRYPFYKKEKWAWNCIFIATLLWFIIDTSYSAYYLVYLNVALNIVLFITIILPLIFTKRNFLEKKDI